MFRPPSVVYYKINDNVLDITETITAINGNSENVYVRWDYIDLKEDIKDVKFWLFSENDVFAQIAKFKDTNDFDTYISILKNIRDDIGIWKPLMFEVQNKQQRDMLLEVLYKGYKELPFLDYVKEYL